MTVEKLNPEAYQLGSVAVKRALAYISPRGVLGAATYKVAKSDSAPTPILLCSQASLALTSRSKQGCKPLECTAFDGF